MINFKEYFYKLNEGMSQARKLYVDTKKIPEYVLDELAKLDPTPQKKYIEWMARSFLTDNDIRHYEVIKKFDELANRNILRGEEKDITRYKNIESIADKLRQYEGAEESTGTETRNGISFEVKSVKQREREAKPEDIIVNDGKFLILHPRTKNDSILYGAGSNWCTTKSKNEHNYFKSYYLDRAVNLYYIFPKFDVSNIKIKSTSSRGKSDYLNLNGIAVAVHPDNTREIFDYDDVSMDSQWKEVVRKLKIPIGD